MITEARIEAMVAKRNAEMKAEADARGAYFSARLRRAESIGRGDATQSQFEELIALKAAWDKLRAT